MIVGKNLDLNVNLSKLSKTEFVKYYNGQKHEKESGVSAQDAYAMLQKEASPKVNSEANKA